MLCRSTWIYFLVDAKAKYCCKHYIFINAILWLFNRLIPCMLSIPSLTDGSVLNCQHNFLCCPQSLHIPVKGKKRSLAFLYYRATKWSRQWEEWFEKLQSVTQKQRKRIWDLKVLSRELGFLSFGLCKNKKEKKNSHWSKNNTEQPKSEPTVDRGKLNNNKLKPDPAVNFQ